MSRLLFILILACLSSSTLLSQGSKGRIAPGTASQSSVAPRTTDSKGTKAGVAAPATPNAADRSTTPQAAQNRPASSSTTFGNTTPKRPSDNRNSQPSDSKATRPATYAPPTNASTAKGSVKGTAQKVAPLKSSERGVVNWMTLEQALEKNKTEKRKIFVDLYTDWCGWCKHMDSTTFVNATVAKYLNEHYYPVKFNAEQESDIVFKDKTYHFKKNGARGYHELAALWLNNRLSFPTVVFLDENQQVIQPVPGYQDAAKMEAIINYFGSDSHKKTPWESYEKNFSNKR